MYVAPRHMFLNLSEDKQGVSREARIGSERVPWSSSLCSAVRVQACSGSSCQGSMARKAKFCQVCWNHKSSCSRWCDVCQRRVNPGCIPEYCLAQDGHDAEPPGRRTLCKDCFISMSQAILPLASTLPEALAIVERNNRGHHRYGAQHAIERASGSF